MAHDFEPNAPPGGSAGQEPVASPGPQELLGRVADERLLTEGTALPAAIDRPAPIAPDQRRRWIVGVGATLTGVTLVGGLALVAAALVGIIASGFGALEIAALLVGAVLVATHWGWVHVAEFTAMALEGRRERAGLERGGRWLASIEPYTRYEISTHVGDDGAITITRTRHRPLPSGEGRFSFMPEIEHREIHSADEPGAVVAERAEGLRRQAAVDTERARQRWMQVAGERETEQLRREHELRIREALRAESEALSERINAHLRDPPLGE